MALRNHVPAGLQETVRRTYLTVGTATGALRMVPQFMVIGSHRCGTTSIFKALAEHPQVMRPPVNKGTDYFSLYYDRSMTWYRGHFPIESLASRRTHGTGAPVAFDACTYYMFHPFALERIAHDLPHTKLVVMLRDPVERAFSAYKHEFARGFEREKTFERALELEDERLKGEYERMRDDVTYESYAHRHLAYRARGEYADQLERAYALFPREQVHVLDSEEFFAEPAKVYAALVEFLGLSSFTPARFDQHNARPSKPMAAETHAQLTEHYRPLDERLADLLGRRPHWSPST